MPVMRIADCKGWTKENYGKLIELFDQRTGCVGKTIPGQLIHVACFTEDGMRAFDVYESEEAANKLLEFVGPICTELDMSIPEVQDVAADNVRLP